MRKVTFTSLILSVVLLLPMGSIMAQSSHFNKSPRLRNVMTTFNQIRVWSATYYFTIEIPEDAGNSVQSVTIEQREGSEQINFKLAKTFAFEGNRRKRSHPIEIESVSQNPDTQAITIDFTSPIPANTLFTLGLKPIRNPDYSGVYLFGVTVYPSGENPQGLYLGPGRLHFYDNFYKRLESKKA